MSNYLFISDAAKEVKVESHVLRYWEEELHLPIKRNELGHRYYTEEDVERFKQIKGMKERGLQLKAIKMILRDGKLDVLPMEGAREDITGRAESTVREREQGVELQEGNVWEKTAQEKPAQEKSVQEETGLAIEIVDSRDRQVTVESKEDKSRRLQWLLQQLIRETLRENNSELCQEIKESVVKELDYQFRMQEERDEARDKMLAERDEEHYKKMDELLRKKTKTRQFRLGKKKKGTSQ
ncbi:MAG: MerR family transcriptional regulator [Acetatifactor sp.]|nr:MerR family transcriptional regulator [Acetatifactor sp.]